MLLLFESEPTTDRRLLITRAELSVPGADENWAELTWVELALTFDDPVTDDAQVYGGWHYYLYEYGRH